METKSDAVVETVSPAHIEGHVGYWCRLEQIRAELLGITHVFRTDEEFLDTFGLSEKYLIRIKRKARDLANEAQVK